MASLILLGLIFHGQAQPLLVVGKVVQSATHQVQLDWIQSSDPQITGNCIYRSIIGTPLRELACVSPPIIQYVDSTVLDGASYNYAVTAVDGVEESELSNMVILEIPK
jgi:hypothetical protein